MPSRAARPLRLVAFLALAAACRSGTPGFGTAPASTAAAAESARPRRVMLISFDGAAAVDLRRYYEAGEFDGWRGFRRFFEEGVVAEALVPVDPTVTSVNHISLATGAPPARTGIVANNFHLPGTPIGETVSGFDAPIGVEALWEAARRQGKRVASAAWPGADGTDPRRQADYGMLYVHDADHPASVVELTAADWGEPDRPDWTGSHSALRLARVEIEGEDGARFPYRLYALDGSDDGRVDYDALAIAFGGAAPPAELAVGKWAAVEVDPGPRGDQGPAVSYVKLLAMAPDLARVRLYVGGAYRTRAYPESYLLDLRRAGVFWPGPPDDGYLEEGWAGRPGIDVATWLEQSDRFAAFFGAAMVHLAAADDWDLALAYVPTIDEAGHELYLVSPRQAGWSRERMAALERARRAVWRTADGLLDRLYASGAMKDTAVVVVSDHGMAPVHSTFGTNVLLRRRGLLATDGEGRIAPEGTTAWAVSGSAGSHIYLRPGLPEDERQRLLAELAALFTGFTTPGGERPIARAVTRREAAALGLDQPNSGDLILFGAPGWVLASGLDRDEAAWSTGEGGYGAHGYLAGMPEMNAIYLALGPGIGRGRIGKLHATEVAGKVAALLGINLEGAAPAGSD